MSKQQLAAAKDCAKFLIDNIDFLSRSMAIIHPIDKEDKKLMDVGLDLFQDIKETLENSESAADFSRVFGDLEGFDEKWANIKFMMQKRENHSITDEFDSILYAKESDDHRE